MDYGFEEGAICRRSGCDGEIKLKQTENCSCHLSAPCSSCVAPRLFCAECDWQEADEPIEKYTPTSRPEAGYFERSFAEAPIGKTKVRWRSKLHSSCSMIKEGVYPESGDKLKDYQMVKKAVDGTFGGRFDSFGGGRFRFIAYTD